MASLTSAAAAHVFRRLSSPPVVRSLAVRQFVSSSARCASRVRPRSRGVVWEQPTRLFERNKLRKERKWVEFAPYVSHIEISYDPANDGTVGCIELWRQVSGIAVRALYPKYTVGHTESCNFGPTTMVVKYIDGREQRVDATHLTVADLLEVMTEFTESLVEKEDVAELEKA